MKTPTLKELTQFVLLTLFALGTSACGKSLSGAWNGGCDVKDAGSERQVLNFDGDKASLKQENFGTQDCTGTATESGNLSGTWKEGKSLSSPDGAKEIDYTIEGTTYYNIYKLDGDKLNFGLNTETLDGTTAAKRPTTLNTSATFTYTRADATAPTTSTNNTTGGTTLTPPTFP